MKCCVLGVAKLEIDERFINISGIAHVHVTHRRTGRDQSICVDSDICHAMSTTGLLAFSDSDCCCDCNILGSRNYRFVFSKLPCHYSDKNFDTRAGESPGDIALELARVWGKVTRNNKWED